MTPETPAPRQPNPYECSFPVILATAAGGISTLGVALFLMRVSGGGPGVIGQAALLYGLIAFGILVGAGRHDSRDRCGPANWVTLMRATLVCGLAGLIGGRLPDGMVWLVALLGLVAFALDGLDGWVARQTGTNSDFGARFDREVDALFVLVLGLLVVGLRDVGPWVLLTGALRYAFVAGRAVWPWLAAELPPSRRRRMIFGAQVLLLLLCLLPVIGPGPVTALAAMAVALVSLSFAVDIFWLRGLAKGPSSCRSVGLK